MYDNKFYSSKGLIAAYSENPNTSVARYFQGRCPPRRKQTRVSSTSTKSIGEVSIVEAQLYLKVSVKDGITIYREEDGKYPVYYY